MRTEKKCQLKKKAHRMKWLQIMTQPETQNIQSTYCPNIKKAQIPHSLTHSMLRCLHRLSFDGHREWCDVNARWGGQSWYPLWSTDLNTTQVQQHNDSPTQSTSSPEERVKRLLTHSFLLHHTCLLSVFPICTTPRTQFAVEWQM